MGSCFSLEISCALDEVLKHVCSCLGGEVNYICNLEKNLADLENAMSVLRANRGDVLERVHREENKGLERLNVVQVWLTSVENIQNQVNELLNPCKVELERLCLCGLCSKNLILSHSYGKRVFDMLKDVEDLRSEGSFQAVAGPATRAVVVERPLQPTIVGHEKMLERAWNHLMDDGTRTMGLYGMGGVGKTTLLAEINNKFCGENYGVGIVIWIVVSSDLRIEKIQDDIAEKLGFGSEQWKQKEKSQKVIDIFSHMKKIKFVLLFDDIWEKVDLKDIGVPYPNRENGCKVVFTTRSMDVCGYMGVDDPMEVKCLESNEAWDLFRDKVGKITLESHPDIVELACEVGRKCHGLPLALNIVGESMASKRTVQEWNLAIEDLTSSVAAFPGMKDHILPILRYSYDSLEDEHVRSCFQYCALYPEDFVIKKEELVDYWICEGFIDKNLSKKRAGNKAHGIIGTLVRACLLTEEGIDKSSVKMHDVVREMALWVASEFGHNKDRCIVQAGVGLREVPSVENWRSVRRMSLMENEIGKISDSPDSPELNTLLFQENKIADISGEFFKSMPMLFVLDLSRNRLLSGLPEEISKLVSLRYLDLSKTGIERLDACLLELKKLIYLNLEWTRLENISGISNLSSLRTLRLLHSGMSRDVNVIKELRLLKHIEEVTIDIGSSLVADQLLEAPRVANSVQEIYINNVNEDSTFTFPSMEGLSKVEMYGARMQRINIEMKTSSWHKNPITPCFPNLSSVGLSYCHGLKDLTWLLFAPNLIILVVGISTQIEDIISKEEAASIGIEEKAGNIIPFQKLEFIQVYNLPKLKSIYWSSLPFPCLKKFSIGRCPNLRKLPLNSQISSIAGEELIIKNDEQYWIDKLEWEDEATKERFQSSIQASF